MSEVGRPGCNLMERARTEVQEWREGITFEISSGDGARRITKKQSIGGSDKQAQNLELVSRDFFASERRLRENQGKEAREKGIRRSGRRWGVPGSARKKDRGESAGRRGGNDVPV